MKNQFALDIHLEYRRHLESMAGEYSRAIEVDYIAYAEALATQIWRDGLLAEIWCIIATKLGNNGIDYTENWRTGQ
jgi:hypothetical protein